mgnify:FL=1|jgi:hypothetical protein
MRINVKKYDENCFYTYVGIPTTRQERKFLKELKYDLIDEYGSMELAKAPCRYVQALIMLGYCGRNDDFCCAVPNTVAIALGYYITGKWRKWAMLRKHIPWLNPVGFHNWTQEEYSQHLDYLDSLIGDV